MDNHDALLHLNHGHNDGERHPWHCTSFRTLVAKTMAKQFTTDVENMCAVPVRVVRRGEWGRRPEGTCEGDRQRCQAMAEGLAPVACLRESQIRPLVIVSVELKEWQHGWQHHASSISE